MRSMDRLEGGIVALDYGDEDHAFQLTVERVPRRRWAATAGQAQEEPPDQPARRLMQVAIIINDALGTAYAYRVGQFGGTGTEWEATRSFRPRPPAEVGELLLTLQAPGQPEVAVPVAP
jgi:hypothetical protein